MRLNDYADWSAYEDAIYAEYLATVAHASLRLFGHVVKVRFRPETRHKGYGFWHLISEAPSQNNRNEDDRIPDLERCARVRWVAWCIENVESVEFSWWENKRGTETHVVIWAELHDFAVVLAKRDTQDGPRYYLLKTAYCLRGHTIRKFTKERDAYWATQKD
ncbi:hypothetical protein [Rhodoferax sp.]|uniref:hypothetical protein n=1 Tax=Rhodoferax sp. TaxID=50421 RepID=UPI002629E13E|nr:hypothetical protein [Rhodoferax sp.]